jgi:cysteine-rich repeat protein
MRAARTRRIPGPLALIAQSLPLIALVLWGCSLDKRGSYNPATPDAGTGGGGGAGGAPMPCGNGTLEAGEECDDGNTSAEDGCDDACIVECEVPEGMKGFPFKHETTHHCYLHIHDNIAGDNQARPWYDALYLCRAHGFDLAALTTPDEYDLVHDLVSPGNDVWIGANDLAEEGTFVWSNGETDEPEPWKDGGEPNNGDPMNPENCVEVWPDGLNDQKCQEPRAYVCERHPPGICGDGVIDPTEECDDGNKDLGDGCEFCVVNCDVGDINGIPFKDPKSGHCYLYDDNSMVWQEAKDTCEAIPGFHLVTLSSVEERDFILSNAIVGGAWVGATDVLMEDKWVWSNRESWEFDPWKTEPGNENDKDCLKFIFADLEAADCAVENPYLCERPTFGKRSPAAPP